MGADLIEAMADAAGSLQPTQQEGPAAAAAGSGIALGNVRRKFFGDDEDMEGMEPGEALAWGQLYIVSAAPDKVRADSNPQLHGTCPHM